MLSVITSVLIGLGLTYFLVTTLAGLGQERRITREHVAQVRARARANAGTQASSATGAPSTTGAPPAAEPTTTTVALVACLDEALVIESTVRDLLAAGVRHVVVVDDASGDDTVDRAAAAGGERVTIVRRELPEARAGKGPALNFGFAAVLAWVESEGLDPARVLVCVMDADGRLSPRALSHVDALFADSEVVGAQLPVRIRNRRRWITQLQDLEFWGLAAVSQLGRRGSATVSLGGNGQFTRLSALLALPDLPWSGSLTEDLDLTVTLLQAGGRLTTTPLAWVNQQGVETWRQLVRQRTRWFQGHLSAGRRLPQLWRSRDMSQLAVLEVTMYLLVPWLLVLPWSIVFHLNLLVAIWSWTGHGVPVEIADSPGGLALATLVFYVMSFLPNLVAAWLYYRREDRVGIFRAFAIGHLLLVGNYIAYFSAWRAVVRMVRGRTGWDKTDRSKENAEDEEPEESGLVVLGLARPVRWLSEDIA